MCKRFDENESAGGSNNVQFELTQVAVLALATTVCDIEVDASTPAMHRYEPYDSILYISVNFRLISRTLKPRHGLTQGF
jgi:hypothetical protein